MVSVNKALCTGNGYCWANCPSVFERDTDGKARVKTGQETSKAACIPDAQENCCMDAIQTS